MSWEDMCRLASAGNLQNQDLVWQEGMANWVKADSIPGLFAEGSPRGRRVAEDEDPVRRSRRPDEDEDRPRRSDRQDDWEEGGDDRPRRRRREAGMPVGLKVGLIVGGAVVLLLVVGVVLILVMRPGDSNQGEFTVPPGAGGLVFNHSLVNSDQRDTRMNGPCKIYLVKMTAGRTYTIDLESNQFDAYLRIENSNRVQLAVNDDGGMGLNSRLIFTPQNTGSYRVIATSLGGMGRGPFTLRLREGIAQIGKF